MTTVHNGVSKKFKTTPESTVKNEFNLPKKYILSVGTFEYQKGQDILIKALKLSATSIEDYHLVLVGRTADYLFEYQRLAIELNIESRVHFFVDIPPSKISDFYRSASIYISSSRAESFGLVILEAAMFNIPVIATKTDGAQEILVHGKDGVLVELEDTNELSNQLETLIKNKEKQKYFSDNLLYKAKHVFTWEKSLSKYISIAQR
jgi:glycosyltransferase involved in cell wall biosynthesis